MLHHEKRGIQALDKPVYTVTEEEKKAANMRFCI